MRLTILILFLALNLGVIGQRKMPNISFEEHSLEFAHANRMYDEYGHFTDTLRDDHIIGALVKILGDNPQLLIELAGHCAMNEDTTIAMLRAQSVFDQLAANGVEAERLTAKGYGRRRPIISDQVVFNLDSKEEREAANQKNRRVEIKVIGRSKE